MGMQVGGSKGALADMNVVPLIDILLVLLIIFMVITPTTPKGLETLVPQPPPPNQQQNPDIEQKTVVVQVLNGGVLKINNEIATWTTLEPRLEDIFKTRAEKVAFIKGDDEVRFFEVAEAIDIMHAAGVEKVGLITTKLKTGQ
jgi:biopolymer transport protein ExbD